MTRFARWLSAGALLLAGCDGLIRLEGNVYEWENAPPGAVGRAYVDEPAPDHMELSPVVGARVRLYHAQDHADESADLSESCTP